MATIGLAILQHTPPWVWGLLALLVGLGIVATRTRRIALRRALVTPLVFMAWGVSSVAQLAGPVGLAAWLAAGALGVMIGLATTRLDTLPVDRARGLVTLPGSWLPLARNLAIFLARYGLAVAAALAPAARDRLVLWDLAVSGLSAGYFLGWLGVLVRHYRRAPLPAGAGLVVTR